jgi:hypothetical protein
MAASGTIMGTTYLSSHINTTAATPGHRRNGFCRVDSAVFVLNMV